MRFFSGSFLRSLGLGFVVGALGVLAVQALSPAAPSRGVVPAAEAAPQH